MALFIPAHLLNDAVHRCPRGQWPAWQSFDVSSPLDELLGSVFPLFHTAGLSPPQTTHSPCTQSQCKGKQPKPAKQRQPVTTWSECVKLPGFAPGEVTAEVKDGRVVILGRQVRGEGDNRDVLEMKRTVALPPDVDADKVVCRYVPGRFVLVVGPRIQRDMAPAPQGAPVDAPVEASASPATVVAGSPVPIDTRLTRNEAASSACPEAAADGKTAVRGEASETEAAASSQTSAAESAESSEETMVMRLVGSDAAATAENHKTINDSETPQAQSVAGEAEDSETKTADSCPYTAHPQACDAEDAVTKDREDAVTKATESDANTCRLTAAVRPTTQPPEQVTQPLKAPEPEKPLSLPSQFEAVLDLRGFAPENVEVTLSGRSLVVKAKRVEDRRYFTSKEEFQREVTLPKNVDANSVRCFLGEDGQLRVSAPYTVAMDAFTVPIMAA